MPIAGSWLAADRRPNPNQAPLHELNPQHDERGAVDENPSWQAEQYQEVAPAPNVIGDEWVTDIAGVLLDRTPDGHDEGGPHGLAGPGELAAAHAVDYGADERESRDWPPFQFSTDRYDQTETENVGPVGVAPVALVRGLTSDPANNPPLASYLGRAFRYGYYRRTWTEHDFSPPERVHTWRIIRPHTATAVGDAPPPAQPGPYNSPFPALARAIRQITAKPAIRRVPEPLDADMIDDGLDQAYQGVAGGDWVAG